MNSSYSLQEGSRQSAREIIPLLLELIQPKSVVDVGCDKGVWLSIFKEFGIEECLGIDGDHVDLEKLQVPPEEFWSFDLKKPLQLNRKFDLVISLEVAQHLPIEYAKIFIDSLTRLGSVILFSAAIPSQGGIGYLNEQWQDYWVQHFQKNEYLVVDYLRKKIWNNEKVEPWYAQNTLLFVKQNCIEKYPLLEREFRNTHPSQLAVVHPRTYLNSFSLAEKKLRNINLSSYISLIPANIIEHDPSVVATVRQIRKEITEFLLGASRDRLENIYSSGVSKVYQMLLNSGIKREPLTDTEQQFVNKLAAHTARGLDDPKAIHYLLIAVLYCYAHQLPLTYEFASIPQWFLDDYLKFMLDSPNHFQEIGEVDSYYRHVQRFVDCIYTGVFNNQGSGFWRNVASFVKNVQVLPLYFSTENLRDIFTKRSEITEFVLTTKGYQVDYAFPERPANRKKLRLGVLKNQFIPHPETYNTLPVFEYLDRDKFEIILYITEVHNHPLEQYCQSRADRLVKLPNDLSSQVQTIRADDLDILFIATVFLGSLVLHRLARIQATYFVSPTTTGMRNVDYYISGNLTEPTLDAQAHYREQLITVDGTGFCFNFTIEPDAPTVRLDRKTMGVPNESIVFISGASFFKIIPELRETWAKIIATLPKAVLALYPFSPVWSRRSYPRQSLHNRLSAVFAKYGIEENRLIMLNVQGRSNVKECLKLADIYLDSCPYSGATNTTEALEAGLPTVVMDGNASRSRNGAALLRELQMPDLIANSEEAYVQLAIALAKDPELRKQKSDQIKQKMQRHPRFMDSRSYSAQMGLLFQELCRQQFNN